MADSNYARQIPDNVPSEPRSSFGLRWVPSAVAVFLVASAILFFGRFRLIQWGNQSVALGAPVEIVLEPKQGLRSFANALAAAGVVDNSAYFWLYIRFFDHYRLFQAGRYRFVDAISPVEISDTIRNGRI